jgi:ABC-type spermidine/putrescine transport system permease subunit I
VILPLTLPGMVVGAFLTFVLCIGDYITPQILGGNTELTAAADHHAADRAGAPISRSPRRRRSC